MKNHSLFLHVSIFITGFASLALELILGRLAAPFFGVSNLVWAVIISVVLVYIAFGSVLGGRLADRLGDRRRIYGLIPCAAGTFLALVTMPGYHALRALYSSGHVPIHLHASVMIFSLLLFSLPVLAASMLLPAVTRFLSSISSRPGDTIGRIYAINTAGSVVGALFAVLVLVPLAGIGWSLFGLSVLLSLCGL
jgi:MFS family permease